MKRRTLTAISIALLGILLRASSCSTSTTGQNASEADINDNASLLQSSNSIAGSQPIPTLAYSVQRGTMIESYLAMSKRKPFYMIATNPGAGDQGQLPIVATAVVKGCVPATFQLINPLEIADSGHDYGYAILPKREINAMYTGDTDATYCIGIDGTFFSLEHITSFSDRPFSDAIRKQAALDYTPTLKILANGTVIDSADGNKVLYDGETGEYAEGVLLSPAELEAEIKKNLL